MPESRWKPKPVCQVSGRDCSGRAQQDSPGKLMPGFVQVCGITGHNILHTGKTGEESVSPGLDIWRALRSDCLFPSKHFGGWVKELGGLGNGESYGTVKATQTHRLTTALTQNALQTKRSAMHVKLSTDIQVNRRQTCMTHRHLTFALPSRFRPVKDADTTYAFLPTVCLTIKYNTGVKRQFGLSV